MNELVKGLSQNDVVTYPHAFFKWVYANPCPSLVGIRRIPAYHVDYTTGKDGTFLSIPRDMKIEVLEKLAETIYSYKAYPGNEEIDSVAAALIATHPCLKEPSSMSGWYGWKISLKFKMGNYRQKLRDAGCQELKVNSEKRGFGEMRGKRNKVKKPRRCETNFLPDLPQGKDRKFRKGKRANSCGDE